MAYEDVRARFDAALSGAASPLAAADRLCRACVDLLDVDGASISVVDHGATRGTFGSSGPLSRTLDELQFTFGEGPCLDAVLHGRPVLAPDLDHRAEQRWPALTGALLEHGVRAVFALPVAVSITRLGALDLYRTRPGALEGVLLSAGLWAARLAVRPLLDLMSSVDGQVVGLNPAYGAMAEDELTSLERVEVYQATGILMAALDVGPAEALVRLRGHAVASDRTVSDVAWAVLHKRLVATADGDLRPAPGGTGD